MATLTITYAGVFLPTMGVKGFEVWIDGALVVTSRGYLAGFAKAIEVGAGPHECEMRAINRLTGAQRSYRFAFVVPDQRNHRLRLVVSRAWGTWRQPVLEPA
jgi:hypothetical protein